MDKRLAVPKTYSLYMDQIAKVSDLAERFQVSQGAVVQAAIDEYYYRHTDDQPTHNQPEQQPAPLPDPDKFPY